MEKEKKGLNRNGGGVGEEEEISRQAKWQNECERKKREKHHARENQEKIDMKRKS